MYIKNLLFARKHFHHQVWWYDATVREFYVFIFIVIMSQFTHKVDSYCLDCMGGIKFLILYWKTVKISPHFLHYSTTTGDAFVEVCEYTTPNKSIPIINVICTQCTWVYMPVVDIRTSSWSHSAYKHLHDNLLTRSSSQCQVFFYTLAKKSYKLVQKFRLLYTLYVVSSSTQWQYKSHSKYIAILCMPAVNNLWQTAHDRIKRCEQFNLLAGKNWAVSYFSVK